MAKEPPEVAAARAILKQRGIGLRHTKNGWFLLYGKASDGEPMGPWDVEQVIEFVQQMQDEGW